MGVSTALELAAGRWAAEKADGLSTRTEAACPVRARQL